ncbi:MAG: ABC transporter permease [Deltaproteobacteria bacterium]|nr:ABC transporter permease [Deltaproteobacteria bacterium]
MKKITVLMGREVKAYFTSPLAYLVLTSLLVVSGLDFYLMVSAMNGVEVSIGAPFSPFFGGFIFYWFFMLVVPPVLTMRLLAEEVKSNTIETLMTAPVSDTQVVLAKYFSSLLLFMFLWLPTIVYVLYLGVYTDLDSGPILSGYLGTMLLGAMFLAAGLFASSLTSNQVVAAVLGFTLCSSLFSIGLMEYLQPSQSGVWSYFNLHAYMLDFGKGVVDTRPIVYTLSTAMFFLFASIKALEKRRWS